MQLEARIKKIEAWKKVGIKCRKTRDTREKRGKMTDNSVSISVTSAIVYGVSGNHP